MDADELQALPWRESWKLENKQFSKNVNVYYFFSFMAENDKLSLKVCSLATKFWAAWEMLIVAPSNSMKKG